MTALLLPGLEANNPLGFLASLGLLLVLDHEAELRGLAPPRLGFVDQGSWIGRLLTSHTEEEIVEIIVRDAAAQVDNRALQFMYDAEGKLLPPGSEGGTRDLKPSSEGARALLQEAATADPRSAGQAAAWFSELVRDNNGNTKPTAFHFTAGQQAFLEMVEKLRRGLTAEHVREALDGPWLNMSLLPSLAWDSSVTRLYALRAGNPSKEQKGSVPGANWLAVLGLACFPVVARGLRLVTTGITGGWKDATFAWPVWSPAASARAIASLVRLDPTSWTDEERAAIGIATVFRCRILRSDQGGYGSFAPATVVAPRAR